MKVFCDRNELIDQANVQIFHFVACEAETDFLASRKWLFLNNRSRHLQFVSGTWSGDSDLAFVRQSPEKEHLQLSTETDLVSQAISLNRSCWMNAFVLNSLPGVGSYSKSVTVNDSS